MSTAAIWPKDFAAVVTEKASPRPRTAPAQAHPNMICEVGITAQTDLASLRARERAATLAMENSRAMQRCPVCDGFVPLAALACPHCDPSRATIDDPAQRARAWHRLAMLLRITGGTAVAMTLMACYGAPPGPRPQGPDEADPKLDKKEAKDAKDPKTEVKVDGKSPPPNDSTDPPTGQAPPE